MQRHKLADFSHTDSGCYVLVVNPKRLDSLFSISTLSLTLQRLFQSLPVAPYHLLLAAKNATVPSALVHDGSLAVRLPHSQEEKVFMQSLVEPEVWEVSSDEYDVHVIEHENHIGVVGGSVQERQVMQSLISQFSKSSTLPEKLRGTLGMTFPFLRSFSFSLPFPLFRAIEIAVCAHSKSEVYDNILELARKRYVATQEHQKVESKYVLLTSLLDYKNVEQTEEFKSLYAGAALQLLADSVAVHSFATHLLGYEVVSVYSGIDILTGVINRIGQQSLPYTVYLLGGSGSAPFKIREYFCAIYPNIALQFIGISAPQGEQGESSYAAIKADIQEKQPDLLFVSVGQTSSLQIVEKLISDRVNFGVAFALGESFNRFVAPKRKPLNFFTRASQFLQEFKGLLNLLNR